MKTNRVLGSVVALLLMVQGAQAQRVTLGPKDGHDLPPTDLERVRVGDVAPDFTLEAFRRPPVTLSQFRGSRNVVLVFYRGHW